MYLTPYIQTMHVIIVSPLNTPHDTDKLSATLYVIELPLYSWVSVNTIYIDTWFSAVP